MARAFGWVAVAYLAAGVVALGVGAALHPGLHPIWVATAADVAATVVVFGFSVAFRNSSFYDPYWSVAPVVIALYWIASAPAGAPLLRQAAALVLVLAWAVRLTANWARSWEGLHHEDWRYVGLQQQTGRAYWLVSFAGIHMAPTFWVLAGCLPLYPALAAGTHPPSLLDALACAVTAGAIAIELVADEQLRRFRRGSHASGEILSSGLWGWSRHPNYFGEMGFWWGLYLFGLAADAGWWWTIVGPLSITAMFRFASLPMIETRMRERRPGWAAHAARTSMVVPWPPTR